MKSPKDQLERNYRNFGIAILVILAVFMALVTLVYFLDLSKAPVPLSSNFAGEKIGRSIRWYFDSGLWFGNIFAFFAALEKRHTLGKGILFSLLGWVYVIYYAWTRKTVTLTN